MTEINLKAAGGNLLLGNLDNPNKMPFSGVLTYLGVPSDQPPGGAGGKKVMIPVEVGQQAIDSLKLMPVNLNASMDDHDTSSVIGVIEDAWISEVTAKGTPLNVKGYIFAKSFPNEAMAIKSSQSSLGFSYETAKTLLASGQYDGEEVAVAESLIFTGAAILYKQSAAYKSTSLVAKGENNEEVKQMEEKEVKTEEELKETEVEAAKGKSGESADDSKADKEDTDTDKKDVELDSQLVQLIPQLISEIKKLQDEITSMKADKASSEKEVKAAEMKEPERKSASALVSKYDDVVKKDTDVFASIDNNKSLSTVDSMAQKLNFVFGEKQA